VAPERTTLFISHANPEDNNFAIWLYSRLSALGYDCWIDRKALLGGEKFWEEIDQAIRIHAIKFLLVYSRNICQDHQPGKLKDGIYKEFSLADGIGKQEKLKDFIQLLNIDESPPNLFIGSDRLNQIAFYTNWADGLKQLNEKLKRDKVAISSRELNPDFADWFENNYVARNGIIARSEHYYTSYWPIEELPQEFYLFRFKTEKQARAVYFGGLTYPVAKISNFLASFCSELQLPEDSELARLAGGAERFDVKIAKVLEGYESDNFPTHRDASNHLKSLLGTVFHLLMSNRELSWHCMANKKQAYYFNPKSLPSGKVLFDFPVSGKMKRKHLVGKYLSLGNWHYAISAQPILTPIVGFSLKAHIVFTTNGFRPWEDKDKMHSHRRSKTKRWFNEEWRDLLLAFLAGLKSEEGDIQIQLTQERTLTMNARPVCLLADFGYIDPEEERHNVLEPNEPADSDSNNDE
jgi:hypothetical protein